ncbi:MAG: CBS domain-containing protein [Gammaproteobacteria bacterium]|nr:CBS domain-containing protein [Gammaproteobacteria bacterium]
MTTKKVVRVSDVMKKGFDVIDGMTTVSEALKKMKHVDTKTLIIDKRDENDEYGVVLISDIAKQVLAKDRAPDRVNVYEVMAKPAISVNPDMDIRYCARLFENFGLSRAPVIECGKMVGIISFTDMVLRGMITE